MSRKDNCTSFTDICVELDFRVTERVGCQEALVEDDHI